VTNAHREAAHREARYQEIERLLRDRVLRSAPGDPLPSEAELAAQFSVSRMTARQAVQNLAREGLVERRRGAGTFVAMPPMHRHEGTLMSFSEDMRRRGHVASSTLLEAGLRVATGSDVEALRLGPGVRVVAITRLRLADDRPLALERVALAPDCAGVLADDLEHGSLHESLERLGRRPTVAHSWITARVATGAEAKLLGLATRDPLLIERRIIYDADGAPLEHTESAYVASRYVIDAVFTVGGAGHAAGTPVVPDRPSAASSTAARARNAAPMAPADGPS
jgi:GntR family transcriptional regulator